MTYNEQFAGKKRWCIVEDNRGFHFVKACVVMNESHPSIKFANVEMPSGQVEAVELKDLFQTRELAYSALNLRYGEEYQMKGLEDK